MSRLIGFIAGHLGFWGIGVGDEKGEICIKGKAHGTQRMIQFMAEEIKKTGEIDFYGKLTVLYSSVIFGKIKITGIR